MAGTAGVPLKDRKYLTVKDMSAHMGLGIIMIKTLSRVGNSRIISPLVNQTKL